MKHELLRYAHDEGHTDVCFAPDGSKFITCGSDGDMRIWSTDSSVDPSHIGIGDFSLSVRIKNSKIYVATGNNEVKIFTYPEGEDDGVLDRFVAPINQIALSRNSDHLALAGEDMEVKLYDLTTKSASQTFDGLSGPCLSVALTGQYLAASSGDGKLRIWDFHTKELKKEIECFTKVNSFVNAEVLCRIDFSPDEKLLAYPENNSIILLNTLSWEQEASLNCVEINNNYSIVQFSSCGKFLAATTTKGDVVIYTVAIRSVRRISKHPKSVSICGLMFNPLNSNEIVYTDIEGQLGFATECCDLQPTDLDVFTENEVNFDDVNFESDDDENTISVEKLKKEVMGNDDDSVSNTSAPTPRPKTPEVPLQPPFMPSSTPEHLDPRYLCWNDVGVIRCYNSDDVKSIEIEFHNSTFHNSIMLQNFQNYTMASVSISVVAVANSKELRVIPLSSKEWFLKLEEDSPEEIILIATSKNLICFATNSYFLRICSIFGTQRAVFTVPGPIVSINCHHNDIIVAYHSAAIRNSDQCINMKKITINNFTMIGEDLNVALSPEATLTWLGFTEVGTPAIMDSLGIFSLYPKNTKLWIPFCDTNKQLKNPSDGFFVTSVVESSRTIFGIKCRGSIYPTITPAPTVCELKFEPLFVEIDTEKTQLEMDIFALNNLEVAESQKKIGEIGLKAFALACKNNLDQRALELIDILSNPSLLNLASKYAVKLNKKQLASKLVDLASKLMEDEAASGVTPTPPIGANRKYSLNTIREMAKQRKSEKIEEKKEEESQSSISTISLPIIEDNSTNPFSKNSKDDQNSNPLSLLNKYAGLDYDKKSEKRKSSESSEQNDRRLKQRKLIL